MHLEAGDLRLDRDADLGRVGPDLLLGELLELLVALPHVHDDDPALDGQGIVDVSDEPDAAVIVIGSRGLTGVKKIFEGSLSQQVAEHAGRPVLIVPPPR